MNFGNKPRLAKIKAVKTASSSSKPAVSKSKAKAQSSVKKAVTNSSNSRKSNWGALSTPEARKEFLFYLQAANGCLGAACANFGIVANTLRYWRKKDKVFRADVIRVIKACNRNKQKTEEEMAAAVHKKWYAMIMSPKATAKDLEGFVKLHHDKQKHQTKDELLQDIPEEDIPDFMNEIEVKQ